MSHKTIRNILIGMAAICGVLIFPVIGAAGLDESLDQPWISIFQQVVNLLSPTVIFLTILFVVYALLKTEISTSSRYLMAWLVISIIIVVFVGVIYFTSYRCGKSLDQLFRSLPPIFVWGWGFGIPFMYLWSIEGALAVNRELERNQVPIRWSIIERVILGAAGIWSCFLATFGLTIWNFLPAC